ncbi:MAG: transketolase [Candidatus Diapherotrites archaeon CG11_big_fil_rev_8_21_14_0_20_37_9]|nr:MAG: transketolase [Candidatus Diapherotrites archaeon CG11_big_fil_rev_8_21_14_0_20_37_9]
MNKYKVGEKAASRDSYGQALIELGEKHEEIIVMDADLAKSSKAYDFAKVFPNRFKYAGISEQDMVSMAAGLATTGKVPFISSFACFLPTRGYDQIRVSVCYSNTNVKITGSHGGLMTGKDGPTGQGITDLALMRNLPNMHVLVPADVQETIACTRAMYENKGPFYMRTAREKTVILNENVPEVKLGTSFLLRDESDAVIIAVGAMVPEAVKAADSLKQKGICVSVLNCVSLKPIDEKAVQKVSKNGLVVSAEDGVVEALGASVAEIIAEKRIDAKLIRVGLNNKFAESGDAFDLLAKYKMDANAIEKNILNGLKEMK